MAVATQGVRNEWLRDRGSLVLRVAVENVRLAIEEGLINNKAVRRELQRLEDQVIRRRARRVAPDDEVASESMLSRRASSGVRVATDQSGCTM